VDITSGKFVFSASEAYLIENGKLGAAVRARRSSATEPDVLTRVSMVGNDLKLDEGVGTCGKEGQSVPVGVGQPRCASTISRSAARIRIFIHAFLRETNRHANRHAARAHGMLSFAGCGRTPNFFCRIANARVASRRSGTSVPCATRTPCAHRLCGETFRTAFDADIILLERDGIPSACGDFPKAVTGGTTRFCAGP